MYRNHLKETYRERVNDMSATLGTLLFAVPSGEKQFYWSLRVSEISDIFYSLLEIDTDKAKSLYHRLRFQILPEIKKYEDFDTKYVNKYIQHQMELSKDMPIFDKIAVLCLAIQMYIMNVFLIYLKNDTDFINKLYKIQH